MVERRLRSGASDGTAIAGRFFRNIGSRSGSTTRTEFDLRFDDRIGAQPERLFAAVDGAQAARVLDAAVERQQHQLELVGAAVAADAVDRR